jgi:hypothetical protein
MQTRPALQLTLLLVIPLLSATAVFYFTHDMFLPANAAYISFLFTLSAVDLERFLRFRPLQELWREESGQTKSFLFTPADFAPPIVRATPSTMLENANLFNVAKLKYLVGETATFVRRMRDNLMIIVLINILPFFLLLVFASLPVAPLPGQNTGGSGGATQGASVGHGGLSPDQIARLVASYILVTVQVFWNARILYHYREKNSDLYFQAKETHSHLRISPTNESTVPIVSS